MNNLGYKLARNPIFSLPFFIIFFKFSRFLVSLLRAPPEQNVNVKFRNCRAQTTNTDGSSSNLNKYSHTRFTASIMTVLLVVFILVVVLLSFIPVCIRNAEAARGAMSPVGIIDRDSRRSQIGLDPAILEVISHKVGKGALECAVCLNEFADEEALKLLPKCDHVFHSSCIDVWLASHSTCPVCRASLEQTPKATRSVQTASEPSAIEESSDEADNPELSRSVSMTMSEPEAVDGRESSNHLQMPLTRSSSMRFILFFSKFPRSNSTGHCGVEPGENVDRFTLKLPSEIRNRIMNRMLNRSASVPVLPTESRFRKGYWSGEDEESGRVRRSGSTDRAMEEPWWFGMGSRFLNRNGFGSRRDESG
uniref:RING-type E3 ubiquitin transferase n=1 Tax=Kalanchoe fedtschenkoi TaxID=63787 RepID=A0A7N0T9T4_KALFE